MGAGRPGSGVELRASSIRVSFTWKGRRCRETLDLKPTEAHRRYAERLVRDIRVAIAAGLFDEAAYFKAFPDSDRPRALQAGPQRAQTVSAYAALYKASLGALAAATRSQYGLAADFWCARVMPAGGTLGARDVASVLHSELAALVGSVAWPSAKARNNSLIALRGIFNLWVADAPRERSSPADGIENGRVQRRKPDPFDLDEVELILADLRQHYDPRVALYFEFAFFAGMRPEEQIALRWSKIDWRRGIAKVDVARTFKGGEKDTKTVVERDVELGERALAVLEAMRPWTQLRKHGHVFEHPEVRDANGDLGKPWHDERAQRDRYWKPSLRRTGVRYRTAYKTRATYVTLNIMEGANPAWVAVNSGHTPAQLWRDYAEWINAADRGRERRKVDQGLRDRAAKAHPTAKGRA